MSSNTLRGEKKNLLNDSVRQIVTPHGFSGTEADTSAYGYVSGGNIPGGSDTIQKFPFASDVNVTYVGDLSKKRYGHAGQSSTSHGYASADPPAPTTPDNTAIDKFPFANDRNGTNVGSLSVGRLYTAGQSSSSHGYTSGGYIPPPAPGLESFIIDKFPFASDGTATSVGNLTDGRRIASGQSSSSHGYTSGGFPGPKNTIDKFSFSSDGNATDVGDLSFAVYATVGQSSATHGYASGGRNPSNTNVIQKFPFASDTNASVNAYLAQYGSRAAGQSSSSDGYVTGGNNPNREFRIERFPFASDTNATSLGDLLVAEISEYAAGHQG